MSLTTSAGSVRACISNGERRLIRVTGSPLSIGIGNLAGTHRLPEESSLDVRMFTGMFTRTYSHGALCASWYAATPPATAAM